MIVFEFTSGSIEQKAELFDSRYAGGHDLKNDIHVDHENLIPSSSTLIAPNILVHLSL